MAGAGGAAAVAGGDADGADGVADEPPAGVAPSGASTNDVPHLGQATQARSSMGALHVGQRAGANGSARPHAGQATTSRLMYEPQCGQGCLNVGIVV